MERIRISRFRSMSPTPGPLEAAVAISFSARNANREGNFRRISDPALRPRWSGLMQVIDVR